MKKGFMGIVAVMLAGAMCIGFAACDENTGNGEGGSQTVDEIEGAEVTAEQWADAIAYFQSDGAKFTMTRTEKREITCTDVDDPVGSAGKLNGTAAYVWTIKVAKNGNKQSKEETMKLEGDENVKAFGIYLDGLPSEEEAASNNHPIEYYEKIEDDPSLGGSSGGLSYSVGWRYVQQENGGWTKTAGPYGYVEELLMNLRYEVELWEYGQFEFDGEKKVYNNGIYNMKFNADGQLVAFYYTIDESDEVGPGSTAYETRSLIFSYEAPEIILPVVEE